MSLLDTFRKKENMEVPDVSSMIANGMSEQDIIDTLRQQGYDSTAIKEALLKGIEKEPQQPQEANQQAPQQMTRIADIPTIKPSGMPQTSTISSGASIYPQPVQKSAEQAQQKPMNDETLETIQQVLEQIIEEKWRSSAGDINTMKTAIRSNSNSVTDISEKIDKLNQRIDSVQNIMLGKTEEYNKTISDVNVELKAFEKVIDRLVPTISDSIKELRDLIDGLKKQQ